jgi:lysophospholipase L1-like esterase
LTDEALLRFAHPERILATTRLPGVGTLSGKVLADLYGIDTRAYERTRRRWREEAEHAVEAMLDDALVARLRALPLARAARITAFGDSITADRQSWAELLCLALDATRGRDRIEVINRGLSGDSTAGALTRLHDLRASRPDVVLILLGTNDARRHEGVMLHSHRETARNLRALRDVFLRAGWRCAWLTPPPLLPERVAEDRVLRERGIAWTRADIVRKAAIVRSLPRGVIDLWPPFGDPPNGDLLLPDGLHPSLAGQQAILAAVLSQFPGSAPRAI